MATDLVTPTQETLDDRELRQRLRALVNRIMPSGWGVIRGLVFVQIDKAPPGYLKQLRHDLKELLG